MIMSAALLLMGCHATSPQGGPAANAMSSDLAEPAKSAAAVPIANDAAPVAPAPADGSFQSFWTRFRAAALAEDGAALASLSAPVVIDHGELDDDAGKKLTPAQVPAAVAKLMADTTPLDGAGHTQRALFESKATIAAGDVDSPGQERISDFVFKAGKAGWRLADRYVGDD